MGQVHLNTDKLWMKCYVIIAWVLNTTISALLLKSIYVYLVKDIGDLTALAVCDR